MDRPALNQSPDPSWITEELASAAFKDGMSLDLGLLRQVINAAMAHGLPAAPDTLRKILAEVRDGLSPEAAAVKVRTSWHMELLIADLQGKVTSQPPAAYMREHYKKLERRSRVIGALASVNGALVLVNLATLLTMLLR